MTTTTTTGATTNANSNSSSSSSSEQTKVKVVCRVRPFLPHEQQHENILKVQPKSITVSNPKVSDHAEKFRFDSCYGPEAPQEDIFQQEVWSVVKNVFKGINTTVFCYGVTGSGKTHTIQGTDAEPGIIPRTVRKLFEESAKFLSYTVEIKFSYLEIYLESVKDLISPSGKKLDVREDSNKNIFISNLSEKTIRNFEAFEKLYTEACKNRSTASTNFNAASSRSHAVLLIFVKCIDPNTNASRTGKIHLIDLAGSEDNRRTGNGKERMAESGAINTSLFALGRVVEALNKGAGHVPFRASKMTRLLQDSLGGKNMAMLIANLAPGQVFHAETINTLNFATKSSQIVNKATVADFKEPPKPLPKYGLNLNLNAALGKPVRAASSAAERLEERRKRQRLSDPESTSTRTTSNARSNVERQRSSDGGSKFGGAAGNVQRSAYIDQNIERKVHQFMEAKVQEMKEKGVISSPTAKKNDIDHVVHERLTTLEKRLEDQKQQLGADISHLLTPETKLKTAKVHILEAKKFCNSGDLMTALMHYKKAGNLRPDYAKLQLRIDEIQSRIDAARPESDDPQPSNVAPVASPFIVDAPLSSQSRPLSNLNPARHPPTTSTSDSFPSSSHPTTALDTFSHSVENEPPSYTRNTSNARAKPSFTAASSSSADPTIIALSDTAAASSSSSSHPSASSSSSSASSTTTMSSTTAIVPMASTTSSSTAEPVTIKRRRRSAPTNDDGDEEEEPRAKEIVPLPSASTVVPTTVITPEERALHEATRSRVESEVLMILKEGDLNEIKCLKSVGKVSAQKIIEFRDQTCLRELEDLRKMGFSRRFIMKLVDSNLDM